MPFFLAFIIYNRNMKLLYELIDDQYPLTTIDHVRPCVRAVVINDKGEIALTKLYYDDKFFGFRDYYELPGGGQKPGESRLAALVREMDEELGCTVTLVSEIGVVKDFYNLIHQENHSYYYLVKATSYHQNHLEPREQKMVEKIVWVSFDEAIKLYENMTDQLLSKLVKARELPVIKIAQQIYYDKRGRWKRKKKRLNNDKLL